MKTIGLIGGMSWESTQTYYALINKRVKEKLGRLHSAKIILCSVDFEEIEKNQSEGKWKENAEILSSVAKRLELAGADFILICTNTMHKVYTEISSSVNIPLIHIADATKDAINKESLNKILLLGTKYTMLEDFYKQRLIDSGLDIVIPNHEDVMAINDIIFNELCLGIIKESSKKTFIDIINKSNCEGIILECTEIGLLISQDDLELKVFDTTEIHAQSAVLKAI